jgi:hypothetical protein
MKNPLLPLAVLFALAATLARADMTSPTFKMRPPAAPARAAATARARLEAVQAALTPAQAALARLPAASRAASLDKSSAALARALADTAAALAWLQAHPEADKLPGGPAPAETLQVRPLALGTLSTAPSLNFLTALEGLNVALNQLLNNPDPAYRGPVLGALGGFREKIMDDIGESAVALREAINADLARREAEQQARQRAEQAAREGSDLRVRVKAVTYLQQHPAKPGEKWTVEQAEVEDAGDHYEVVFSANEPGTLGGGAPTVLVDKKTLEVTKVLLGQ